MQMPTMNRFDLQPKFGFYVSFDDFFSDAPIGSPELSAVGHVDANILTLKTTLTASKNHLKRLVKTFDRSDLMIQPGPDINIGPIKIGTLGSVEMQDFLIEFYADADLTVEKLYYCWLGHMMDPTTGLKFPRQMYEKDITLYFYDREVVAQASVGKVENLVFLQNDLMETLILTNYRERRIYRKCYPATMEKIQFSVEESGFVEGVNITFVCNGGVSIQYGPDATQNSASTALTRTNAQGAGSMTSINPDSSIRFS